LVEDGFRGTNEIDVVPKHCCTFLKNGSRQWAEAARAVGSPYGRIALRHIMPNVLPPLIIQVTSSIASAVIAEASLSSLRLGQ
jgi:ABC-type dipeptide/oligopeptide/nickel transport system permease subunit